MECCLDCYHHTIPDSLEIENEQSFFTIVSLEVEEEKRNLPRSLCRKLMASKCEDRINKDSDESQSKDLFLTK